MLPPKPNKCVYIVLLAPDNRIILYKSAGIYGYKTNSLWKAAIYKQLDEHENALIHAKKLLSFTYKLNTYDLHNEFKEIDIHVDNFSSYSKRSMILFIAKLNSKASLNINNSYEVRATPFINLINDIENKDRSIRAKYVFDTEDIVDVLKTYYEGECINEN